MTATCLPTLHSSVAFNASAFAQAERAAGGLLGSAPELFSFNARAPKAAQQSHQRAEGSSGLEHRTTTVGGPQRSNSALVSDTFSSPLRAQRGAAQRERWAAG